MNTPHKAAQKISKAETNVGPAKRKTPLAGVFFWLEKAAGFEGDRACRRQAKTSQCDVFRESVEEAKGDEHAA